MKEALYYEKHDQDMVICHLCPNECQISPGKAGKCLIRVNKNGTLYATMFRQVCSMSVDPIEKKPLYHFLPGSQVFSFGSYGCNLKCQFCQNHQISQVVGATISVKAKEIIKEAKAKNCLSIAATYNEPLINIEFLLELFPLAQKEGLKTILVTNAYLNKKPLEDILEHTDALNIDLKAFDVLFYERYCSGKFIPIIENIRFILEEKKWHVELTNLLVTSLNDSKEHINNVIDWAFNVAPQVPFHFSKYYPNYQTEYPETSEKLMHKTYKKAIKKLDYVYLGNILDTKSNSSYCPKCKHVLISRQGYKVDAFLINEKGECINCGRPADFVLI